MARRRSKLTYAAVAVLAVVVLVLLGFLLGVLGVPSLEGVDNRFGPVNESTTTVVTNVTVANPNPISITVGGLGINYTVEMNDVRMAVGDKRGLSIERGSSRLRFETLLDNDRIPRWWYTHVRNGERTKLVVNASVSHGLLGGQEFSFPQEETVETDILGAFNSTETREMDADQPPISDPVLYLNETAARYGSNVTRERTPLETAFTVHNPKPWPYTVTEIGYTIEMNNVTVGEGSTRQPYAVPPGGQTTLRAETVIRNDRLDEWWVSHLRNDQVTTLGIDFYVVVDPDVGDLFPGEVAPIRVDTDAFDYRTTIETDIFGTKGSGQADGDTDGGGSDTSASGGETDATDTPDGDGDGSDGRDGNDTPDDGSPEPSPTPTPTPTPDPGPLPTDTPGGGIL
jgi:LEA14-like dessication related protein